MKKRVFIQIYIIKTVGAPLVGALNVDAN